MLCFFEKAGPFLLALSRAGCMKNYFVIFSFFQEWLGYVVSVNEMSSYSFLSFAKIVL